MSKTHLVVDHTGLSKNSLMFELRLATQNFIFPHRLYCQAVFNLLTVFSVLKPGVLSALGLEKWGSRISAVVALCGF